MSGRPVGAEGDSKRLGIAVVVAGVGRDEAARLRFARAASALRRAAGVHGDGGRRPIATLEQTDDLVVALHRRDVDRRATERVAMVDVGAVL